VEENVRHLNKIIINHIKNPQFLASVFDGFQDIPFREIIEHMGKSPSDEHNVQVRGIGE